MATLEAAVEAYRDAQAKLPEVEAQAATLIRVHRQLIEQRRKELAAAMVAAAEQGWRPKDIESATGYNRESVRRILRAGGIEAAD